MKNKKKNTRLRIFSFLIALAMLAAIPGVPVSASATSCFKVYLRFYDYETEEPIVNESLYQDLQAKIYQDGELVKTLSPFRSYSGYDDFLMGKSDTYGSWGDYFIFKLGSQYRFEFTVPDGYAMELKSLDPTNSTAAALNLYQTDGNDVVFLYNEDVKADVDTGGSGGGFDLDYYLWDASQPKPERPGVTEEPAPGEDTDVKVSKITITSPSKKIAVGKRFNLAAEVSPSNATVQTVTWKSSNKNYATVNAKGVLTAKKAGQGKYVTITAAAADSSGVKSTLRVKIMKNAVTNVALVNTPKTLKVGKSATLKANVSTNGKNANTKLKWTSSNKKYATVNSNGKVSALKAGKGKVVKITASSTDGSNKSKSVSIRII